MRSYARIKTTLVELKRRVVIAVLTWMAVGSVDSEAELRFGLHLGFEHLQIKSKEQQ